MYFRFTSAVALVVAISVTGVALEKRGLELRRESTRQSYRTDLLHDRLGRLRLHSQQLGAPTRFFDSLESGSLQLKPPQAQQRADRSRLPLLRWQRPPSEL